jgi:hypothetical protein
VRAADTGDVLGEEAAIRRAAEAAFSELEAKTAQLSHRLKKLVGIPVPEPFLALNAELLALQKAGKVRRGKSLGTVGDFVFFSDRILAPDHPPDRGRLHIHSLWKVFLMDEDVHASVETAGSITVSRRPTLTRMAAGAMLPGSALIPGFALAKKETFDDRELYFIFEHPEGGAVVRVNPNFGQQVRQVAAAVNAAASNAHRERQSRSEAVKKCPDCAEDVKPDARVCKHCGYRFAPPPVELA